MEARPERPRRVFLLLYKKKKRKIKDQGTPHFFQTKTSKTQKTSKTPKTHQSLASLEPFSSSFRFSKRKAVTVFFAPLEACGADSSRLGGWAAALCTWELKIWRLQEKDFPWKIICFYLRSFIYFGSGICFLFFFLDFPGKICFYLSIFLGLLFFFPQGLGKDLLLP